MPTKCIADVQDHENYLTKQPAAGRAINGGLRTVKGKGRVYYHMVSLVSLIVPAGKIRRKYKVQIDNKNGGDVTYDFKPGK